MSPSARTSLKLGFFAIFALIAIAGIVLGLGIRVKAGDGTRYHTYFDESVQGLDKGAMVKFRGVRIGKVTSVSIAARPQRWNTTPPAYSATSNPSAAASESGAARELRSV